MSDRNRDPWSGYDNWRLGRIRAAGRTNKLLSRRPVLLPSLLLALGLILAGAGFLVSQGAGGSEWIRPLLFGCAGLLMALGLGGLFSALLVRIFGTEGKDKDGRRPWV